MKNIFTLFVLLLSIAGLSSKAQNTNCNAEFSVTYLTGNTVQFNPVVGGTIAGIHHIWYFGEGGSSALAAPVYTYGAGGVFTAEHIIIVQNPNGVEVCRDTFYRVVQVQNICNLAANFYSNHDSIGTVPNTYIFVNTTLPLNTSDSVLWTFGDGTSSNQFNPHHTYAQPGTYTVCLRVQQRNSAGGLTNCVSEICHPVVVVSPSACTLVANFVFSGTASSPFTYHFENTSTPLNTTDSIRWTFGDGTSSNQVNPTHTYTSAGTYTVCLRIQQREPNGGLTNCIKEICHTVVVTNPATCTLIASFYSYLDTIGASPLPNLYHFINTSAPLNNTDSIRWTFGDGASSNEANPSHSYAQPGTYNVCLRVQKREPNGTLSNCIREVCHMVVVTAACNIQAHFTWIAGANPQVIHFTNNSLSPTIAVTASWSFGDGSSSTAWSPVHDYAHAGTYTVCLNIQSGPNCISHYCASVVVPASPVDCIHQSDFGIIQSTTNSQLFYFVPDHINTTSTYTWTFGDGTGSHNTNVSHQYPQAGNYTACLTVYHDTNCASTSCHSVTVLQQVNCANVNVTYSYQHDPVILNQLYFHAISGTTLIDQVWTITKLPSTATTPPVIIHQNNPTYTFQDTGHYRVCLRAVTAGGCVKEYCEIIFITQVNPANCILQVYPNPATNFIYFILNLSQPQTIDTYIYNTMNVLVQEQHQAGVSGTNAITVGIANLPAGIYTMKVIHGNDVCYAQIVKL